MFRRRVIKNRRSFSDVVVAGMKERKRVADLVGKTVCIKHTRNPLVNEALLRTITTLAERKRVSDSNSGVKAQVLDVTAHNTVKLKINGFVVNVPLNEVINLIS